MQYFLSLIIAFVLLFTAIPHLQGQVKEGQELVFIPGLQGVVDINVNKTVATTVTLPAETSLVTGYGLINQLEQVANFPEKDGVALLHYQQVAGDTIVLRLVREGLPCFITAKAGGRIYMLRCVPADEANLAVVVTDSDGAAMRATPVEKKSIAEERLKYDPMALVGILSRAKQRPFLENVNPSLYAGWEERNGIAIRSKNGPAEVVIYTIQKWPEKDAIILRSTISNSSNRNYIFDPRAVNVRVADRVYPAQLADASGSVPPFGEAALDVVLMGNVVGGKEHLSVDNDFRIELAPPVDQSMSDAEKEEYYRRRFDEGVTGGKEVLNLK